MNTEVGLHLQASVHLAMPVSGTREMASHVLGPSIINLYEMIFLGYMYMHVQARWDNCHSDNYSAKTF